jgi:ribosome-associated protein
VTSYDVVMAALAHSGADGVELAPGVYAAAHALRMQFSRSGGPGGQNVNKVATKAELWLPLAAIMGLAPVAIERLRHLAGRRITAAGDIHLISESERGQQGNKAAIMQRLRELIVAAKVEPKLRKKRKVSRAARAKRVDVKKRRGEVKRLRRSAFE